MRKPAVPLPPISRTEAFTNLFLAVVGKKYDGPLHSGLLESDFEEITSLLLQCLTYRERTALSMRFGLEKGQRASRATICQKLGVTQDYLKQVELRALRKLRHPVRRDRFRYLMQAMEPAEYATYDRAFKIAQGELLMPADLSTVSVEALGLGLFSRNILRHLGIENVGQLTALTRDEFLALHHVADQLVDEISAALGKYNLQFKPATAD